MDSIRLGIFVLGFIIVCIWALGFMLMILDAVGAGCLGPILTVMVMVVILVVVVAAIKG